MDLKIKRMEKAEGITLPNFYHEGDVGCDIRAAEEVTVQPGKIESIDTGLKMQIPEGHAGLIWEKSGLAFNHGIKTAGGVIDRGYRGEVKVAIFNAGDEPYTFARGDKIAQILVQKVERPEVVAVEELSSSSRGEDGFGSTGKK
ncbi:MAG: dUTP diphosphatase [Parcubacteria group bacterium SW_6_46_9]|nr:MAG: dUTP diphosphatase [Parcubacteria group bacterium SW_6_46_9]